MAVHRVVGGSGGGGGGGSTNGTTTQLAADRTMPLAIDPSIASLWVHVVADRLAYVRVRSVSICTFVPVKRVN